MSEGDSNFFSRWSRRKIEVREVAPAPAPPPQATAVTVLTQPATPALSTPCAPPAPPAIPAPTLADVEALTMQSDYTRFVARDVAPEVKQAALKKLFTDPHFNIMDGLDTYIDDYGKPDPLPPGMLRKMMQSQMLGLFDHEKKVETPGEAVLASDAHTPDAQGGQVLPTEVEPAQAPDPPAETPDPPVTRSTPPPADP